MKKAMIHRTLAFVIVLVIVFLLVKKTGFKDVNTIYGQEALGNVKNRVDLTNPNLGIVKIKEKVLLDSPVIKQFPELPRGCEVTSLAMLLQDGGIDVGKMELAKRVKKNPTPYKKVNGQVYFGHPNDGFVGDMYSYGRPGLGVYYKPIIKLAEEFLPGQIIDLTGTDFSELQTYLSLGVPVWIITNTQYKKLSSDYFERWKTPKGEINITYKEHSVLITGYDEKFIYFNDPITGKKNKKILQKDFLDAWIQMGRQAVTYLP